MYQFLKILKPKGAQFRVYAKKVISVVVIRSRLLKSLKLADAFFSLTKRPFLRQFPNSEYMSPAV